jgi:hypothetical protein
MDIRIRKWHEFLIVSLTVISILTYFLASRPPTKINNISPDPAAVAAIAGVVPIYNVDYRLGLENWISKVCAHATENGCQLFKELYAPGLWRNIQQNKMVLVSSVSAVRRTQDHNLNSPNTQIWELNVSIVDQSKANAQSQDQRVFAIVASDRSGQWVFERLLTKLETPKDNPEGTK